MEATAAKGAKSLTRRRSIPVYRYNVYVGAVPGIGILTIVTIVAVVMVRAVAGAGAGDGVIVRPQVTTLLLGVGQVDRELQAPRADLPGFTL